MQDLDFSASFWMVEITNPASLQLEKAFEQEMQRAINDGRHPPLAPQAFRTQAKRMVMAFREAMHGYVDAFWWPKDPENGLLYSSEEAVKWAQDRWLDLDEDEFEDRLQVHELCDLSSACWIHFQEALAAHYELKFEAAIRDDIRDGKREPKSEDLIRRIARQKTSELPYAVMSEEDPTGAKKELFEKMLIVIEESFDRTLARERRRTFGKRVAS